MKKKNIIFLSKSSYNCFFLSIRRLSFFLIHNDDMSTFAKVDDVKIIAIHAFFDEIRTFFSIVIIKRTLFTFTCNNAKIFNMFEVSTTKTLLNFFFCVYLSTT